MLSEDDIPVEKEDADAGTAMAQAKKDSSKRISKVASKITNKKPSMASVANLDPEELAMKE